MKVIRNIRGKDEVIELTKDEILKAFHIQEREFYLSDISNAVACINESSDEQIDADVLLNNEVLIQTIIHTYDNCLYAGDGERWEDIIRDEVPDECYIRHV